MNTIKSIEHGNNKVTLSIENNVFRVTVKQDTYTYTVVFNDLQEALNYFEE